MTPKPEKYAIPCAACRDLMPLVQDDIASPESAALVADHIAACPQCRALWEQDAPLPALPDDKKVLGKLKMRVSFWLLGFVVAGLLVGAFITATDHAHLILLLFPLVGGVAYWMDSEAWKLVPVLAAVTEHLVVVLEYTLDQHGGVRTFLILLFTKLPATLGFCAAIALLCLLGMLAAKLLKYAIKGEEKP